MFIYYQIYESLKKDLSNNLYKPGEKLPSENVLLFDLNRHTIRRSLQLLKNEGILFSKRGSGIIVHDNDLSIRLEKE